ncbi:XRE family transcriptional regulator [Helicobacter mehlei]|uniref:LexA family transcriptional regulator n=1 Tax=Helicobacter mehlei TaxID=2316080 RepID=A0A553ULE6_9HELI|nr:XRE family transcriptional regulator [Helicobacter mehlei]TSA80861.1 LexA family transcriptional regulator [Helicobacter mehlei]
MLKEKLKQLRNANNLTQEELALKCGVSLQSIKRYESEQKSNITLDTLEKLASALNTDLHFFTSTHREVEDIVMVPYFKDMRAGMSKNQEGNHMVFLPQSRSFLKKHFGITSTDHLGLLQAVGNSMEPLIKEGDLLLFQNDDTRYEGAVYVVNLDSEYYVKRLCKRPQVSLISDNPVYQPIILQSLDEIEILGRVVGVLHTFSL